MTDARFTLLVVEDDAALRSFLVDNLTTDGFAVLAAEGVRDALRLMETKFPDLAVLDLGLADGDGLDLVSRVREADGIATRIDPALALLALTGRSGDLDRVRGFARGVDDYLCKPFGYLELKARIDALLRRTNRRARRGSIRVGPIDIDPAARRTLLHGRVVDLSRTEFSLLLSLARDPTRVRHKEELMREVWGFRSLGSTRTLDSHACRLRAKLRRDGDCFVINVWGVGYRLADGPIAAAGAACATAGDLEAGVAGVAARELDVAGMDGHGPGADGAGVAKIATGGAGAQDHAVDDGDTGRLAA